MTTKHTPGKLVVNGKQSIRGEHGEYIAKANWNNGPANAARIVHTWNCHDELVGALYDILDGSGFLCGGDWDLEGLGISQERGAEIRAIYNKAKGE